MGTNDYGTANGYVNMTPYINSMTLTLNNFGWVTPKATSTMNTLRYTVTNTETWTHWVDRNSWVDNRSEQQEKYWNASVILSNRRLAARQEQEEQRIRVTQALNEREAAKKVAEVRARELLLSILSPQQRSDLEQRGHFLVRARSGNVYKIESNRLAGNVVRLDRGGQPAVRYCCHLYSEDVQGGIVTISDNMLTQKLAIEFQEDEFLQRANATLIGVRSVDVAA